MKEILRIVVRNIGKITGAILAFFIALMIAIFGLLKTIFIILCVLLGYYIGTLFDDGVSLKKTIKDIMNLFRPDQWR
jgi:uncharacterized membrane protein